MDINDLNKDMRRLLLKHWNEKEINGLLKDPEYFFEQLVIPRLDYLKANGEEDVPRITLGRKPGGELLVTLKP